jgi:hypothetical protein
MSDDRIQASVGMYNNGTTNCYNLAKDVSTILGLLNAISGAEGGTKSSQLPPTSSPRDLFDAILNFQQMQNSLGRSPRLSVDGHVDPGAHTLATLNEIAHRAAPTPKPPSVLPPGVQVIPFTEPTPLLISAKAHNPSKPDLTSTPTSTGRLPFVARVRVDAARKQPTPDLEAAMSAELAVPDLTIGKLIGTGQAKFFFGNPATLTSNTHGVGSDLSDLVKNSPEFKGVHQDVKDTIGQAIATSALSGVIDYHVLAEPRKTVAPPRLGFGGVQPLHVYIGSFQGVNVFLNDFSADPSRSTYSAELTYEFLDHFGADDSDTVLDTSGHGSPGQVALWVLQRERHPGHMPFVTDVFINESITDEPF